VRDVAVTGLGVVSALGHDVDSFIDGLTNGTVRIRAAPWAREGPGEYFSWMSLVTSFDPMDWMDEKVRDGTDLFSQYALGAAIQAVTSVGLADTIPPGAAVVHGTTMGGVRALMKAQHDLEANGPAAIDRKTMIRIWPNMAAAQIAMRFGLHGPHLTGHQRLRVFARCGWRAGWNDRQRPGDCSDRGRYGRGLAVAVRVGRRQLRPRPVLQSVPVRGE